MTMTATPLIAAALTLGLLSMALTTDARADSHAKDGVATRTETKFSLVYSVSQRIDAPPETIWALLTDAERMPEWNSTVTSIDGKIADGEKIKLHVTIDPEREFKLKISKVQPNESMVWSDGTKGIFKGVRTYTLTKLEDGQTEFQMTERLAGLMVPMIKKQLPDFRDSFTTYAADLKQAAEGDANEG